MANSQNMSTSNQYIWYKVEAYTNSQSAVTNSSNITFKIWAWRSNTGYNTTGTGWVSLWIEGDYYRDEITTSQGISSTPRVLMQRTIDIKHNADGTRTVPFSVKIAHSYFNSSPEWQQWDYKLTNIELTPNPVTEVVQGGEYEKGGTMTCTWKAPVTGVTPNKYYIYHRYYKKETNSWTVYSKFGESTTTTYNYTITGKPSSDRIQMRVTAVSSTGNESNATDSSNYISRQGIKVWNGTNFVTGQVKVWDGSNWVQGYARVWDGSNWVISN